MNKVIFKGKIAKDLELKQSNNGTNILRFPIALQRMKKDDGADFVNCIAFNKTAETISNYLGKGSDILFEGHVQTGSYDAQDGSKRYTTDFIVDRFEFVGAQANNKGKDNSYLEPVEDGDVPF